MNNSRLAMASVSLTEETVVDRKPQLRERETQLIKIIEAIEWIEKTKQWSSLKTEVFDGLVITLSNQINEEAKKENPDSLKLNRLAGQLKWAEKYADLKKFAEIFRVELTRIRTMLYGKTE